MVSAHSRSLGIRRRHGRSVYSHVGHEQKCVYSIDRHRVTGASQRCVLLSSHSRSHTPYSLHTKEMSHTHTHTHTHTLVKGYGRSASHKLSHVGSSDIEYEVCNLAWGKTSNEIVSTHGYSQFQVRLMYQSGTSKFTHTHTQTHSHISYTCSQSPTDCGVVLPCNAAYRNASWPHMPRALSFSVTRSTQLSSLITTHTALSPILSDIFSLSPLFILSSLSLSFPQMERALSRERGMRLSDFGRFSRQNRASVQSGRGSQAFMTLYAEGVTRERGEERRAREGT